MVQGYSGHATYNGGLEVVRKVIKSDGIRELSRGFGLSGMTYSSSSAVRWASDGSSHRLIRKSFFELQFTCRLLDHGTGSDGKAPSQGKIVLVQAAGGIFAAATTSCIITPLDTIKTRLLKEYRRYLRC
ncbi:uncharacterized protein LOC105177641 [Sesamum indicum]|uniref:Uncharacterized protein LOC105177641 n=1 Tax=Sesamum indicum TaxID=4182 RepID=A0A8M8V813_SESIN|nr:uncharacterized protein LOC105177641 [Sesamum indicum]